MSVGHKLNPPLLVDISKRDKVWGAITVLLGDYLVCATEFVSRFTNIPPTNERSALFQL